MFFFLATASMCTKNVILFGLLFITHLCKGCDATDLENVCMRVITEQRGLFT